MIEKYFLGILFMSFFALAPSQSRLYIYKNKGKSGLVDAEGNSKTKVEFDQIADLKKDEWTNTSAFLITKNDRSGLISYDGKFIFQPKFEEIFCKNDSCRISENSKVGYATYFGKIIIPNSYDNLGIISEKKSGLCRTENGDF